MLDRNRVIIADHAKCRDEVAPELSRAAVADRAEEPRAVQFVTVMFGIEHAVDAAVPFLNARVLRMDVPNGPLQGAHCGTRVNALPNQVRGIEVRADLGANGSAQFEQRLRVIHDEAGMHFERDLTDAVLPGEGRRLRPIRDDHFVPLVIQDVQKLRRPRASHPIWLCVARCSAGAAAEGGDDLYAELRRKPNASLKSLVVRCSGSRVRMDGIPMHGEAGDLQATRMDRVEKVPGLLIASQQGLGIAMLSAAVGSDTEFNGLHAKASEVVERLLEGQNTKDDGEDAEFHRRTGMGEMKRPA